MQRSVEATAAGVRHTVVSSINAASGKDLQSALSDTYSQLAAASSGVVSATRAASPLTCIAVMRSLEYVQPQLAVSNTLIMTNSTSPFSMPSTLHTHRGTATPGSTGRGSIHTAEP